MEFRDLFIIIFVIIVIVIKFDLFVNEIIELFFWSDLDESVCAFVFGIRHHQPTYDAYDYIIHAILEFRKEEQTSDSYLADSHQVDKELGIGSWPWVRHQPHRQYCIYNRILICKSELIFMFQRSITCCCHQSQIRVSQY